MYVTIKYIIIFVPLVLQAEALLPRPDQGTDSDTHVFKNVTTTNSPKDSAVSKFAPRFKRPNRLPGIYMKPVGSSIRLKCAAEGNPAPNITWLKNHEAISRPFPPSYGKWSMAFEELRRTDNGTYSCVICNELGCINHTTEIVVQEKYSSKPHIEVNHPGNITASLYDTVSFWCPVTTDLEPFIYWTWRSLYQWFLKKSKVMTSRHVTFQSFSTMIIDVVSYLV